MKMGYRQVHLDFHTSEHIKGIGEKFSKEKFQEALKAGHVDSITLFSKCHHGWAYHPSKANEMHPNLKFNLLQAQIEAAHEIGVKTPVYISAGLDEKMARRHPEWLVRNKDESTTWAINFVQPGYHKFCMNSPYLDYLLEQIKEVCANFDDDGIFLDIVGTQPCYCQNCIKTLLERGLDPEDDNNINKLAEEVYANYTRRVREAIDSVKPGDRVFHNGAIKKGDRSTVLANSHLEIESLPTGGWGYDHFPMAVAYLRLFDMEYLGMTGKFHKSWGEFGGFKHPNALRYEAGQNLSFGAKMSVGDQLHPSGEIDMATYELIGKTYKEIEEKEPWLEKCTFKTDVAILSQQAVDAYYDEVKYGGEEPNHDTGATRIMLEGKYQFDLIDTKMDFGNYKVLVLPDVIRLDDFLARKIKDFVEKGGKVLATGKSGLDKNEERFALDFGIEYVGENKFKPTYFRPDFDIPNIGRSAFVMYSQNELIKNVNAKELGIIENPYFNRTTFSFSSHLHTPNNQINAGSSVVEGKDGIYISWQVFEDYKVSGSLVLKEMVKYCLDRLLQNKKTVETNLPAQGRITLAEQKEANRFVNHLLYGIPVKRGENTEIIEDIIPVYDIDVLVRVGDKKIKKVYLAPQMEEIAFEQKGESVSYRVDKVENHQLVVLDY